MNKHLKILCLGAYVSVGFFAFLGTSHVDAAVNYTEFRNDSRANYGDMPSQLPDDTQPSPSQYFVLAGGDNIDNTGGNARSGSGSYSTAGIVMYTNNPGAPKDLNFNFVSRLVNANGGTGDRIPFSCNNNLTITAFNPDTGASASTVVNADASCGTSQVNAAGFFNDPNLFGELRENDPETGAINSVPRGVYYTWVTIRIQGGSSNQSSFRLGAQGAARIGYQGGIYNNFYGSLSNPAGPANYSNGHSFNLKWRSKCGVAAGNSQVTIDDGDENLDTGGFEGRLQSDNGRVVMYTGGDIAGGSVDGTFNHAPRDHQRARTFTNGVPDRMGVSIQNVSGGNGFGVVIPRDSGSYYFNTCPRSTVSAGIDFDCTNGGRIRPSGNLTGGATRYFMTASVNGVGIANSGGSQTTPGQMRGNQQWWDLPDSVKQYFNGATVVSFEYDTYRGTSATASTFIQHFETFTVSNALCMDTAPTMSASLTCNSITISAIGDANNIYGRDYHYFGVIYQRNADGSRGGQLATVDGRTIAGGTIGFDAVPGVNNNHGLIADIGMNNYDVNGNEQPSPGGFQVPVGNMAVGACYTSTCTVSLEGNIGAGANQVAANSIVNVTVAFTNTGDGDNDQLEDQLGGNQLTFTQSGGSTTPFGPIDFLGAGSTNPAGATSIPLGATVYRTFQVRVPSTIGSYTLEGYPDYNGRFAIAASPANENSVENCRADYNTYQPFDTDLTSTPRVVPTDDLENPDQIEYTNTITRRSGAASALGMPDVSYYEGNIATNVVTNLEYRPNGGARKPNDFNTVDLPAGTPAVTSYSQTYRSSVAAPPREYRWLDSAANTGVKEFNHGGVTDVWAAGDSFCSLVTVATATGWYGPSGVLNPPAPASKTGLGCQTISDRPFVRVYGNDVLAGNSFKNGPAASAAQISAYSRGTRYPAGSGVEFAAIAAGQVSGFSSVFLRTITSPTAPNGLTFGNSPSLGNGPMGEQMQDWYESARDSNIENYNATSADLELRDGEQQWINGNVAIAGDGDYSGRRTIFVNGDVTINGNIVYNTTNARSEPKDVPSLIIIAKGNIRISWQVTQLDGLFIAQPTSTGAEGAIFTCTTPAPNATTPGQLYQPNELVRECGQNQLKVNGGFISQKLLLLRTKGTLRLVGPATPRLSSDHYVQESFDANNAAESIRLTPEFYLSEPVLKPPSITNGKYDSIKSLPPVL